MEITTIWAKVYEYISQITDIKGCLAKCHQRQERRIRGELEIRESSAHDNREIGGNTVWEGT